MKLYNIGINTNKKRKTYEKQRIAFTLLCHMLAAEKIFDENVICQFFQIEIENDQYGFNFNVNEQQACLVEFYFNKTQQFMFDLEHFLSLGLNWKMYNDALRLLKKKVETFMVAEPNFGFQVEEQFLRYLGNY